MEKITVKLNGKEYDTYIDKNGVQRFVGNFAVKAINDATIDLYNREGYVWIKEHGIYTMNDLSIDYQVGHKGITLEDMIDFHTMIEYSVSGFMDLSHFEDVTVENPYWD